MNSLLVWSQHGFPFLALVLGLLIFKLWKVATLSLGEIGTSLRTTYIPTKLGKLIAVLRFFVSGPSIILEGYTNVSCPISNLHPRVLNMLVG
jgi:hypothetical protein